MPHSTAGTFLQTLTVGATEVAAVPSARNLGVIADQVLSMDHHMIKSLCHAAVVQLRNIADVRGYLTREAVETRVHAIVTTRLGYNAPFISAHQQHQCRDSSTCKIMQHVYTDRPRQTTLHHTSALRPSLAARQVQDPTEWYKTWAAHLHCTRHSTEQPSHT